MMVKVRSLNGEQCSALREDMMVELGIDTVPLEAMIGVCFFFLIWFKLTLTVSSQNGVTPSKQVFFNGNGKKTRRRKKRRQWW